MTKHQVNKFKECAQLYFNQSGKPDPVKRNELINTFTPIIKYIASRMAHKLPSHISPDDLVSCGIIGLIDAIDKFDVKKEVQFKTYAEFRIKGAMLDELRALDWMPRSVRRKISELETAYAKLEKVLGRPATDEEVAESLDIDLEKFYKLLDETKTVSFMDIDLLRKKATVPVDSSLAESLFHGDQEDPFTIITLSQLRNLMGHAISELPKNEKLTVSLYYFDELTMKEIGQVLGYTESRISQMHSKAMLRLRNKLKQALDPT